ncbi:MAG: helix-turn-helix domain-containing protein [Clostridia bacterium]|nr:helix-turn-helix domain-containing protein [Clostridia bacterium]
MTHQELITEFFKENFSNALLKTGKSAKEIANLTGLKYQTIKNYLDKKSVPYFNTLVIIVNALGLDINEIYDF